MAVIEKRIGERRSGKYDTLGHVARIKTFPLAEQYKAVRKINSDRRIASKR